MRATWERGLGFKSGHDVEKIVKYFTRLMKIGAGRSLGIFVLGKAQAIYRLPPGYRPSDQY